MTELPAYESFRNTYSGRSLLTAHSLDEYGVWEVRGEDPNCDMGGHHHEPLLGLFEGKLEDVIAHATSLPNWFQWGAGGSIKKYVTRDFTKITPEMAQKARDAQDAKARAKQLTADQRELLEAQQKLAALQRRVRELGG